MFIINRQGNHTPSTRVGRARTGISEAGTPSPWSPCVWGARRAEQTGPPGDGSGPLCPGLFLAAGLKGVLALGVLFPQPAGERVRCCCYLHGNCVPAVGH